MPYPADLKVVPTYRYINRAKVYTIHVDVNTVLSSTSPSHRGPLFTVDAALCREFVGLGGFGFPGSAVAYPLTFVCVRVGVGGSTAARADFGRLRTPR